MARLTFSSIPANNVVSTVLAGVKAASVIANCDFDVFWIYLHSAYIEEASERRADEKIAVRREIFSRRTREALAVKKADGAQLGNRTNLSEAQAKGAAGNVAASSSFAKRLMPTITGLSVGRSLSEVARILNTTGVPTMRGGSWTAKTVTRVISSAQAQGYVSKIVTVNNHTTGIALAKLKGKYKGRPANSERNARILLMLDGGMSWTEVCDEVGCSRSTLSRLLVQRTQSQTATPAKISSLPFVVDEISKIDHFFNT